MNFTDILLSSFDVVLESSVPQNCLPEFLPEPSDAKTYVIGAGKAAAKMAQVFEDNYKGEYEGMVITRYGFVAPTQKLEVVEASHPNPDQQGRVATKRILDIAHNAQEGDVIICLLSGGGSSLMSCPHDEIDFEEYQSLNDQLLKCGASIQEMNCLRKHLNQAFGGKLAKAAYPAKIITLSISDVAGDDPSTIASGPTVGDPTTLEEARDVIVKYELNAGPSIVAFLNNPDHETPNPDDEIFSRAEYRLIATPEKSLQAAAQFFKSQNIQPYILSTELEGDTNECAALHGALVKRVLTKDEPFQKPCVIISGGETTVRVSGKGQGGPNTQFMLKLALDLGKTYPVFALACDTDGIDGIMDNAGAVITPETLVRAKQQGVCAKKSLDNNDSYNFFKALDDLVKPGPTHTNVNDYRAIIIT